MPAKRAAKVAPPPPEPEKPTRKLRGRVVPVTVGLPPEMVDLLDVAADRERRSRTNLIEAWLAKMLEREGYMPPQGGD